MNYPGNTNLSPRDWPNGCERREMMSADEVVREERHDTEALNQRLRDKLAGYREAAKQDPTFNPIGQLGLDVSRLLASGEVQGAELSDLIQFHTKRAFLGRADRLARYLGELDFEANLNPRPPRPGPHVQPHPHLRAGHGRDGE